MPAILEGAWRARRFVYRFARNPGEETTVTHHPAVLLILLTWGALAMGAPPGPANPPAPKWALAIHGGAGVIQRGDLTSQKEVAYRAGLNAALAAGQKVLAAGGSSLDAVEATIRVLEDDPLFNAGRGAVFTADGRNELDASIMDGATLRAGAVAGVDRKSVV